MTDATRETLPRDAARSHAARSDAARHDAATRESATLSAPAPAPRRSRWRQPLSFEVQCWIAWSGLFAFGLSGLLTYRELGAYPPLELGAVVLALCWAIDLVRTGRSLRKDKHSQSR